MKVSVDGPTVRKMTISVEHDGHTEEAHVCVEGGDWVMRNGDGKVPEHFGRARMPWPRALAIVAERLRGRIFEKIFKRDQEAEEPVFPPDAE